MLWRNKKNDPKPLGVDGIAQELQDIKEIIKKCCCCLLQKEFTCTCGCTCECTCSGGEANNPCCCIANSQCDDQNGASTVTIPEDGNVCITKIYASFIGEGNSVPYAKVTITSDGETLFCHYFGNETGQSGSFDTTLVQPLCVPAGAEITITPYGANNRPTTTPTTITVAYCPDCDCETPPLENV
ncbi:hypothetical protein GOM49_02630 [Clostridium bovifaecis]|uniref:DUF4489 domain-containing protein n=1 Tax=Clostridium bovifaecis TaxID=2184719 RepID=A0A6I6ETN8_9CLOT|nr:hypothetical protein GOM49_02630 [Clostridium bovifaecis]